MVILSPFLRGLCATIIGCWLMNDNRQNHYTFRSSQEQLVCLLIASPLLINPSIKQIRSSPPRDVHIKLLVAFKPFSQPTYKLQWSITMYPVQLEGYQTIPHPLLSPMFNYQQSVPETSATLGAANFPPAAHVVLPAGRVVPNTTGNYSPLPLHHV